RGGGGTILRSYWRESFWLRLSATEMTNWRLSPAIKPEPEEVINKMAYPVLLLTMFKFIPFGGAPVVSMLYGGTLLRPGGTVSEYGTPTVASGKLTEADGNTGVPGLNNRSWSEVLLTRKNV